MRILFFQIKICRHNIEQIIVKCHIPNQFQSISCLLPNYHLETITGRGGEQQ